MSPDTGAPHLTADLPAQTLRPAVTTRTVAVPSAIDATGATDVSDALDAFLSAVPNGSIVTFGRGSIYRLAHGLELDGRTDLVLDGEGATLRQTGFDRSALALVGCVAVAVHDFIIEGDNADAGTPNAYHPDGQEFAHGVAVQGSHDIEVANVTITDVWGDGVFIAAPGNEFADWSGPVWIHDAVIRGNGRMGVVVNAGHDVTVERVTFDEIAISVFDIEPDAVAEGAVNAQFVANTVGSYGLTSRYVGSLLEASGVDDSTARNITLSDNVVDGNAAGFDGKLLGINVRIDVKRAQDVRIIANRGTQPADGSAFPGAILDFAHVDGLTVTGNVQQLTAGNLLRISDSTLVTSQ